MNPMHYILLNLKFICLLKKTNKQIGKYDYMYKRNNKIIIYQILFINFLY